MDFLGMARVFNGIGELVVNAKSCGVYCRRLVKRSEALWGHNLTRDSRVDGASMTCLGASENLLRRSFCSPTVGSS
jgi:hypothetical protein